MGHAKHKCRKRNANQNQDGKRNKQHGRVNWEGTEESNDESGAGTELIEEGLNFVTLYTSFLIQDAKFVTQDAKFAKRVA